MTIPRDMSFMRSLCMGEVESGMINPFPQMKSAEVETIRGVSQSLSSWLKGYEAEFPKWDKAGEFPDGFIKEMSDMGIFSLVVPEEHGGLGLSNTGYSRMIQELAQYDGSIAVTAGAHSSIGMRALLLFGNEDQRKRYYSKLASGELIAAFCLTEAGAGSDAASIKTKAVKEGDHWVLSGEKIWITNAGFANFFTVFAKTDSDEGKITAFLVTRDMEGVSVGPHEDKMGLRANSTATVFFDKVKIPSANVIGGVGKGFKVAMSVLNSGRTGLGGGSVGGMKRLIKLATKQANERKQFGKKIAEYGLIKQKIGHMVVECYASESAVAMVAGLMDQGYTDYAIEAAISKVFGTECLWRTADESLQIAGGNGYMCEFPYERIVRDCRINRIFEGTNDILRLFIALSAMNDVGKQLKELGESLGNIFQDPIKGFGVLSEYGWKRISSIAGFTGSKKGSLVGMHKIVSPQTQIFENGVRELSTFTDRLLRKHGKKIIDEQIATKRLADVMIDLFVLACVISRVSTAIQGQGEEKSAKELEILKVFSGQVERRVRGQLNKIDSNDDQEIKSLANIALQEEQYIWDNM